ncbi:MAG: hypothetical protein WDM91_02275 [Rhizomicrobium sp.]
MQEFLTAMGPVLKALGMTGLAVLTFSALRGLGIGPEPSLLAGLVLAGSLNIHGLASLKPDRFPPTSVEAAGEH